MHSLKFNIYVHTISKYPSWYRGPAPSKAYFEGIKVWFLKEEIPIQHPQATTLTKSYIE
jgi:hypothetical protein